MQTLQSVFDWLMANFETLLAIAFAVEVVAVQIVNLTPTTVDNKVLAVLHKVLVFVANIVPNTKTTPKEDAKTVLKGAGAVAIDSAAKVAIDKLTKR